MDTENTSATQYKPVTVDVPEDRLAEFHAFFSRFLAGPRGRGRGGRHGRLHGRHERGHRHGSRCAERRETSEQSEPTQASTEI
jgi:hypothetical protein